MSVIRSFHPLLGAIWVCSLLACVVVCVSSCSYAERKWKQEMREFNKGIDQKIAQSKRGKTARCEAKGGVMYNEQCYVPDTDPAVRDEQTCRLHGGLYINQECLRDQRRTVHMQ